MLHVFHLFFAGLLSLVDSPFSQAPEGLSLAYCRQIDAAQRRAESAEASQKERCNSACLLVQARTHSKSGCNIKDVDLKES